jgi:RNA ligase
MTKLNEILNVTVLEKLIEDGYVSRKLHNEYPLAVLNYTPQAQYDPKLVWGNEMNLSRGLVYCTDTMEVIGRPFAKFWNFSDSRHPETMPENLPNEVPMFLEKLDGSMGVLFEWDGLNYVATRGSFHSEQAEWATNWIRTRYPRLSLPKSSTIVTEIIYKENKIVIDYDFEGLVVLGSVNIATGVEIPRSDVKDFCRAMGLELVKEYKKSFTDCLTEDEKNREGYVITYPSNGLKIKVKFETYCQLHRLLTGLNIHSVWELLRDNQSKTIDEWLVDPLMPATFKEWISSIVLELNKQFSDIHLAVLNIFESRPKLDLMTPYKESRKILAAYFMKEEFRKYSGILFGLLDEKCIDHSIWKMIEPSGNNLTFKAEGE